MAFTPLVRWRNFTLDNLKYVLEILPDIPKSMSRSEVLSKIEEMHPGYKRTIYQFACQLGIEARGDNFKVQNYLYSLTDKGLILYLEFWFKNYVTPNPYVNADQDFAPINIFYELGTLIINNKHLKTNFRDLCNEKFGSFGSMDILINVINNYGKPIKVEGDSAFINSSEKEELNQLLKKVEAYLPTKRDNEGEFFDRFSYQRFKEFFEIGAEDEEIRKYKNNQVTSTESKTITFRSNLNKNALRNLIVFGAPGTGKSFKLNEDKDRLLKDGGCYERVTFHPDYSYANFVGTYKPVPNKDSFGEDSISYKYVPGPFMRIFVKAMRNCMDKNSDPKPYLLLIEEINRANTAAVFGDVFQLLDRKENISEYPIQASEDMKEYLSGELGGVPNDYNEIKLPDNMFIWATMNSADQGVFPMDTAFKRRWSFEYLDIDAKDSKIENLWVELSSGEVEWNLLRKAINKYLTDNKVNEDKLLGPFFINAISLKEETSSLISGKPSLKKKEFSDIFENKVLMYLFEDAARQRPSIFNGCGDDKKRFSKICKQFDEKGIEIFDKPIIDMINSGSVK